MVNAFFIKNWSLWFILMQFKWKNALFLRLSGVKVVHKMVIWKILKHVAKNKLFCNFNLSALTICYHNYLIYFDFKLFRGLLD